MNRVGILGLGLNGMISAIACKNAGFETIIFERGDAFQYKQDCRTSALTPQSINFLKELGLFNELKNLLSPMMHIYTFEGQNSPILGIDSSAPLGFVIHNFDLKEVLLKKIKELKIKIKNKKVEDIKNEENFAIITTEEEQEKYKLVLNCGGMSFAKKDFNFPYNQTAFVFNINHVEGHKNIAVESFCPEGPLAILPLINQNESAVIWTVKTQTANFLKSLERNEFLSYFKFATKRMSHVGEVLTITSDIYSYFLELSFSKCQINGRTVLLGDCFNSIHPVAGSSFNMSLKDIRNLYLYLLNAQKLGLDVGSKYELKKFAKSNIINHLEMNTFTHLLIKLFSNSNPALEFIRKVGIAGIDCTSPLKNFLINRATGY